MGKKGPEKENGQWRACATGGLRVFIATRLVRSVVRVKFLISTRKVFPNWKLVSSYEIPTPWSLALDRGLTLLEHLAAHPDGLPLASMASELDMPLSACTACWAICSGAAMCARRASKATTC